MPVSTHRPLPAEIRAVQDELEQRARDYGLDFFETIFEVVDYEEMSMLAAFGGFPLRYPHWRFGAQYDELMKGYSYGLQKIYEMVINTDPCYAYLLDVNAMTDQKLVIAHVYGHCDFFKNNAWFARTNRKMLDQMANHAARVNRYIDRFGYEAVEEFIDACLSIEDLIDPYSPHIKRVDRNPRAVAHQIGPKTEDETDPEGPASPRKATWIRSSTRPTCSRREAAAARQEAAGEGREPLVPRRAGPRRAAVPARARAAERLAARRAVDHPRRGVLLRPAGADEDHERGLGQLLALDDHDAARARPTPSSSTMPTITAARWPPARSGSTRTSWGSSCSATSKNAGTRASSVPSRTIATTSKQKRNGTSSSASAGRRFSTSAASTTT